MTRFEQLLALLKALRAKRTAPPQEAPQQPAPAGKRHEIGFDESVGVKNR